MPRKILAFSAHHFTQPLFDLGIIDVIVIHPAFIAGVVGWIYVPTDFDTKRKALSRANAAEKGLK